ncbi:hypothetical protein AB0P21_10235 [Kribbella sp. NPDC056861]|uniref:hypothetical protein n=1 Tax=Kribbella sp. NPDC056861 TaxID=3154857 RepID=UPI003433856F
MRIRQLALAVAGLSLVTGAALAGQANADVQGKPQPTHQDRIQASKKVPLTDKQAAAAACSVTVGAINAAGINGPYKFTATKPVGVTQYQPLKVFGVRASSSWYLWAASGTTTYYAGFVLQGGNLYAAAETYKTETSNPVVSSKKLGTGWTGFSTITSANFYNKATGAQHLNLYGLHANGSLYRYSVLGPTGPVASYGSAPGYKSFKAITTIASTATYDTLLATTKQGALWTIHIPVANPLKATLKAVRTTGFGAYDQLVAQRCGTSSTLLTGFNNTANTATVYAVSKANGAATVINTIGTAAASFDANTHFLYTGSGSPQLVGE